MSHLILVAFGLAVVWLVRLYFVPFAPCRRCKGAKSNRISTRKRFGPCGKCGGSGSRQVLGSKHVHRAVRGLRSANRNRKDS